MVTERESRRSTRTVAIVVLAVVLSVGAVCVSAAVLLTRPHGSAAPSATTSFVAEADIAKVQAAGYLLATTAGTPVDVVRASGKDVWDAFFPDVSVGEDTADVQSHDLIVVRSTTNVPQGGRHQLPGATPVEVAVVGIVIDSVTGRIVERMSAPASSAAEALDLSVLGTPTVVVLTDVTPPTAG